MPIHVIDGVAHEVTEAELNAFLGPTTITESAVRSERDILLAETDWWSCSDRTMTQAEIDYRQALRDVPAQAGFPTDITWPTKP